MIHKLSLPNTRYGHLMPPEDSVVIEGLIFSVADGITRDPSYNVNFKKKPLEKILENYPNPSGARFVADIFCAEFLKTVQKISDIKKGFLVANNAIARYNKKRIKIVDYLVNDYFGCTAAGGMIRGNRLHWGVIGDCGIAVYSRNGKLKFQSPNSVEIFEHYTKFGKIKFRWETPEGRKLVRSQYRNNLQQKINGICVSYGVLTGEKTAEAFMYFGKLKLTKGDLVIFYTDGFESTIKHNQFFKKIYYKSESLLEQSFVPFSLSLALKNYEKYGRERSLIAIIYETASS